MLNSTTAIAHVMGPEGVIASVVMAQGTAPQTLYHHRDLHGSSSLITTSTAIVERQHFEPFGAMVDRNGRSTTRAAGALNNGFTGHELDRATGYVNARGRMYDPRTRRFLSTDPLAGLGGSQSWNPFSYVHNNPTTYTDPSGFNPVNLGPGLGDLQTTVGQASPEQESAGIVVASGGRGSDAPIRLDMSSPVRIDDASAGVGPMRSVGSADLRTPEAVYLDSGFRSPPPSFPEGASPFGGEAQRWVGQYTQWQISETGLGHATTDVRELGMVVGPIAIRASPLGVAFDVHDVFDEDLSMTQRVLAGVGILASVVPVVRGLRGLSALEHGAVELPAALRGGEATTHVYFGVRDGERVYVGITNNVARRTSEHARRFDVRAITTSPVTRGEARAIEQALIRRNPHFENLRNSISPAHRWHDDAVGWGESWLRANGL